MKLTQTLLIIFLVALAASAQNVTIVGRVVDTNLNGGYHGIAGATVQASGAGQCGTQTVEAVTDPSGFYTLTIQGNASVTLTASAKGYSTSFPSASVYYFPSYQCGVTQTNVFGPQYFSLGAESGGIDGAVESDIWNELFGIPK